MMFTSEGVNKGDHLPHVFFAIFFLWNATGYIKCSYWYKWGNTGVIKSTISIISDQQTEKKTARRWKSKRCHIMIMSDRICIDFNKVVQYIPRNMHTVFALLCFVVVIHWLIFPYPSGLLHWHCGNLTIAPVPAKQPWWIWINTSCEFIMNDCITTTKQSTTKPSAYFLGYTVRLKLPATRLFVLHNSQAYRQHQSR